MADKNPKTLKKYSQQSQQGFTLVEVVVALAIFGLMATGLLTVISQASRSMALLQDRTDASILADEKLIRALLDGRLVKVGEATESCNYQNKEFFCTTLVAQTGINDIYRYSISVRRNEEGQVLASANTLSRR